MRPTVQTPGRPTRLLLALFAALCGAALLAGCGGGASPGAGGAAGDAAGEVVIGLTDAEGAFLRYEVDVLSIRLTRANGTEVEALPLQSRVDFAELTEMTEFVSAQSIPLGRYTAASLTLDYGGADVAVEDAAGEAVAPTLLDEAGTPVTVMEMRVVLDTGRPLVVAPGVPAHLTLDFDLDATHTVAWSGGDATVTVAPLLAADVGLEDPKPHRVRGPLLGTDADGQRFTLGIRPLRARRHLGNRHLGRVQVLTGDDTVFEVDGVSATGAEGFALLAAQLPGTAVRVVGDPVRGAGRQLRAAEVYAGSSVPGGDLDVLVGTVLARAGDLLTVRGTALDRDGAAIRRDTYTVALGAETTVSKQGEPGAALDAGAVSVGQRVLALGAYDPAAGQLDANSGHLRLLTTRLTGTVVATRPPDPAGGELDVALQLLGGLRVDRAGFDFAGTGDGAGNDADPVTYTVGTATLSQLGLGAGDPVQTLGYVSPFGAAPPDFAARSIVAVAAARARLQVHWPVPAPDAVTVAEDLSGLTLDLTEAGTRRHVVRAGVASELAAEPAPQIVPDADPGLYVLRDGRCTVYLSFARFAEALSAALQRGAEVAHVGATGVFDDASQTLTARGVRVRLR